MAGGDLTGAGLQHLTDDEVVDPREGCHAESLLRRRAECSAAELADRGEVTAHRPRQLSADREAEPNALFARLSEPAGLNERIEDRRHPVGRDPWTGVMNPNDHVVVGRPVGLSGNEGPAVQERGSFVTDLRAATGRPARSPLSTRT